LLLFGTTIQFSQEFYASENKSFQCLYQTTDNNLSKLVGKVAGSSTDTGIEVTKQQLLHNHMNMLASEYRYKLVAVADKGEVVFLQRKKNRESDKRSDSMYDGDNKYL
jgi:hypothetical protein